uniref:Uncharacterized protein n=1 Tax=uncultured Caudovirales phage TaxID=2100421 RepID=A0A6J5L9N6_9CAUD|nr:hypothetical protein UFOVP114_38 [uncultured Caudovirales phage]
MRGPFSQIERARRDTLLHKAEGDAFDRLAGLFGVPRLAAFPIKFWRRGLLAVGYGPRGTPGCTHAFLEGVLGALVTPALSFKVKLYPALPQGLGYLSGGATSGFTKELTNRLVRVDSPTLGSRLCYVVSPSFNTGPAVKPFVYLANVRTGYWDAADWSVIMDSDLEPGHDYQIATATFLPFYYTEPTPGPIYNGANETKWTYSGDPCTFNVYVDGSLSDTPPTYLLDNGDARPDGQPYGGAILADAGVKGDAPAPLAPAANPPDAVSGGPFAWYFTGGTVPGLAETLDPLLAAGVQAKARAVDFTALWFDG